MKVCRAKIKVRYSLLCAVSCFALYALLTFGARSESLFRQAIIRAEVKDETADNIKHSFEPAMHDGRELLNEVPRTRKTKTTFEEVGWHEGREGNAPDDDPVVIFTSNFRERAKLGAQKKHIARTQAGHNVGDQQTTSEYKPRKDQWAQNRPNGPKRGDWLRSVLASVSTTAENVAFDTSQLPEHNGKEIVLETAMDVDPSFAMPTGLTPTESDENLPEEHAIENTADPAADQTQTAAYEEEEDDHYEAEQDDKQEKEEYEYEDDEEKGKNNTEKTRPLTIFNERDGNITYYNDDYRQQSTRQQFHARYGLKFPMTPKEAISLYGDKLPFWEHYEIRNYPKVWFLGLNANKTQFDNDSKYNFGFDEEPVDDDSGYYKVVVGDHIVYRYEIVRYLGSGTFGLVIIARDWSDPSGRLVALKVMHFDEDERYITREIEMMKMIESKAENKEYFSRMLATFEFRNHKCLVLELLGDTMGRKRHDVVRNMTLFRRFARDIFKGMYHLHQINVIHGDLKPDNIMYIYGKNNKSSGQLLKIADFGIGCVMNSKKYDCPAYYIQTRYYRAPEVILGLPFTTQADMFSVGVILAEFFLGVPPFFGETETDQLAAMMEVLGLPPADMVARSPRKKVYTDAICYTTENGFHRVPYRKPFQKFLQEMIPALLDLIARLLEYDPTLRLTAEQALRHPFVTGVYPAIGLPASVLMKKMMALPK